MVLAGCLLAGLQHLINAQNQPDSTPEVAFAHSQTALEPTRRIEMAIDRRLSALANVICHEQIARYARTGNSTSRRDTLDLNVEVLNGTERYSQIRRKEKIFQNMQKVPGTWSVGEMATLLRATRDAIDLGGAQVGQDEGSDLGRTLLMTFSYPASAQRWYLRANSQIHWLPFEGRVWTAPDSGEIRRMSWLAKDLPTQSGVTQVLWTVDFGPVDLSSMVVTLPRKALYQITYNKGADHVEWNETNFSEYRRYGSEFAIHFDE
jgi:hypothetical protein